MGIEKNEPPEPVDLVKEAESEVESYLMDPEEDAAEKTAAGYLDLGDDIKGLKESYKKELKKLEKIKKMERKAKKGKIIWMDEGLEGKTPQEKEAILAKREDRMKWLKTNKRLVGKLQKRYKAAKKKLVELEGVNKDFKAIMEEDSRLFNKGKAFEMEGSEMSVGGSKIPGDSKAPKGVQPPKVAEPLDRVSLKKSK